MVFDKFRMSVNPLGTVEKSELNLLKLKSKLSKQTAQILHVNDEHDDELAQ